MTDKNGRVVTELDPRLVWLIRSVPEAPDSWGFRGVEALFSVTYATIGAIVISRRPHNAVGRILAAFVNALGDRLWSVDPDAAAEHLLNEVVDAYGAKGGRIEFVGGRLEVRHATGDPITDPALAVTVSDTAGQEARIELGPRDEGDYTAGDRNSVKNALGALAAAVARRH